MNKWIAKKKNVKCEKDFKSNQLIWHGSSLADSLRFNVDINVYKIE